MDYIPDTSGRFVPPPHNQKIEPQKYNCIHCRLQKLLDKKGAQDKEHAQNITSNS